MTNFTVENQQLKEVISMLESKMEYMEIRLKDADDTMERFEEVLINTSVERDQLLIEKVHDLYIDCNTPVIYYALPYNYYRTQS